MPVPSVFEHGAPRQFESYVMPSWFRYRYFDTPSDEDLCKKIFYGWRRLVPASFGVAAVDIVTSGILFPWQCAMKIAYWTIPGALLPVTYVLSAFTAKRVQLYLGYHDIEELTHGIAGAAGGIALGAIRGRFASMVSCGVIGAFGATVYANARQTMGLSFPFLTVKHRTPIGEGWGFFDYKRRFEFREALERRKVLEQRNLERPTLESYVTRDKNIFGFDSNLGDKVFTQTTDRHDYYATYLNKKQGDYTETEPTDEED